MYTIKHLVSGGIEVFSNANNEVVIKTAHAEHHGQAHFVHLTIEQANAVALALTALAHELEFNASM